MFSNEPQNNDKNIFYTNNPDDAIYTNNPDDEENINNNNNNNNNKLFFDDNNEIKNEEENLNNNNFINKINIEENNPNIIENNIENNIEKINENNNENIKENNIEKNNNNIIEIQNEEPIENQKEEEKVNSELVKLNNAEEKGENKEKKEDEVENNEKKIENQNDNNIKVNKKEKNEKHNKDISKSKQSNLENNSAKQALLQEYKSDNNIEDNEEKKINFRKNICKILIAIFFGQLICLLCVGNGYFVQEIQRENGIITPLLINSSYYFILFLLYFFISKCKIKKPKWIYLILSICDTQANFINVFIFSFIQFEYPYIINILSTIWTVVFTLIIIRIYKYLNNHIIGLILCLVGVVSVFIGIYGSFDEFVDMFSSFNDQIKGLLLSILVSIIYGLNAVLMEKFISSENEEIKSFCTWLGIFGFGISLLESFIPLSNDGFEFQILFDTKKDNVDAKVIIFWILAAIFLAAMTSLSPFYIQKFSATMYNVSLVFTIFWSYMIDSIFIKKKFEFGWLNILYFVGLIIIIVGTVIFSRKDRVKKHDYNYS